MKHEPNHSFKPTILKNRRSADLREIAESLNNP